MTIEDQINNLTDDTFEKAIQFTLEYEGGYSNDPNDPGGATNFGWTLGTASGTRNLDIFDIDQDGDIDIDDIKQMNVENAKKAYYVYFWKKYRCDELPGKIGFLLNDCNINHGPKRGIILLQRALNKTYSGIFQEDGIMTDEIIESCNNANLDQLVNDYVQVRIDFYNAIVKNRPASKRFLKGWLRRANSTKVACDSF